MGGVATPFSGGFVPPGAPGSPESGPSQQSGPPDQNGGMEALLGQSGQQPMAPDAQEHLRALMRQYRQVEQLVEALAAASGPETAPFAREIKDSLRKMMAKATSAPGAMPEPPAPRTMA